MAYLHVLSNRETWLLQLVYIVAYEKQEHVQFLQSKYLL